MRILRQSSVAVDRQHFVTIVSGTTPRCELIAGRLAKVVPLRPDGRSPTPTPLTRAGGRIVSLRMVRENAPRARK